MRGRWLFSNPVTFTASMCAVVSNSVLYIKFYGSWFTEIVLSLMCLNTTGKIDTGVINFVYKYTYPTEDVSVLQVLDASNLSTIEYEH